MENNWTSDDIKLVEGFIEAKARGFWVNGGIVTETYNRVLNRNLKSTNCSTCIKTRVSELERAYNQFKQELKQEEQKEEQKPIEKPKRGRKPKS